MRLIERLQNIPDFRRKQGCRYPLIVILLITIMRMMSGRGRYRELAAFARANQHDLVKFFHLQRKRLASQVTFRAVIKGVDCADVMVAFNPWASQSVPLAPEEWLAMDGKAVASTVTDDETAYQNFVSLVSVGSHKRGQVHTTAKLANQKSREIPTGRA